MDIRLCFQDSQDEFRHVLKSAAADIGQSGTACQPPPANKGQPKKPSKTPDLWLLVKLILLISYHQYKWKGILETEGQSIDLEWLLFELCVWQQKRVREGWMRTAAGTVWTHCKSEKLRKSGKKEWEELACKMVLQSHMTWRSGEKSSIHRIYKSGTYRSDFADCGRHSSGKNPSRWRIQPISSTCTGRINHQIFYLRI